MALPTTGYCRVNVTITDQAGKQNRTEYRDLNPVSALTTSVGTVSTTNAIADVTASFSQSVLNNNFATLAAKVNAVLNILTFTE